MTAEYVIVAECVVCKVKGTLDDIAEHFETRAHLDAEIAQVIAEWHKGRQQG